MATRPSRNGPAMPKAGEVALHRLPPQLRMLVRAIGEDAAFRLVKARGGTVLHVPVRLDEDHPLCDLLGPGAYGQLVQHYGSTKVELPKADSLLRQVMHARVHELDDEGATLNEIALSCNYSRRHVINILADKRRYTPDQGDLFDAPADDEEDAEMGPAHNPFGLGQS